MLRSLSLLLALATLSAAAHAQTADPAGQSNTPQTQPAPIVRAALRPIQPSVTTSQPVAGVWLQTEPDSAVKVVSADANKTEIRVDRGVHVARHQCLIDQELGNVGLEKIQPGGAQAHHKDQNQTLRVRAKPDP